MIACTLNIHDEKVVGLFCSHHAEGNSTKIIGTVFIVLNPVVLSFSVKK